MPWCGRVIFRIGWRRAEEKRELLSMLQSLGSDAAGIFSRAVELQLLEAGQGKAPPPYENICNFFNRELSKAWLGATLTVDTSHGDSTPFSRGPQVHNDVRLDIRQDDIVREGRTIRRDVLGPVTRMRFGPAAPADAGPKSGGGVPARWTPRRRQSGGARRRRCSDRRSPGGVRVPRSFLQLIGEADALSRHHGPEQAARLGGKPWGITGGQVRSAARPGL